MTYSLNHLLKTKPVWCSVRVQSKSYLEIGVKIVTDSGFELFNLKVLTGRSGSTHVMETDKSRLPVCCPDRHINPGGTFCISYDSTKSITSDNDAEIWWDALYRYLKNQLLVDQVRKWPVTEGLSHGDAAVKTQRQIEVLLSNRPSLLSEALRGMFRRTGWLGATLPKFSRKGQLYKAPRVCPRRRCSTCREAELDRLTSGIKPNLCPDLRLVRQTTFLEILRRRQEKAFMQSVRKKNKCCGTLKQCSLRDFESWY